MNNCMVLDCTLRDGGYVNNWEFGNTSIKKIVNGLGNSNIDIIECGFYSKLKVSTANNSIFSDLKELTQYSKTTNNNPMYVCMINYKEVSLNEITDINNTPISGLRVAFHKKDRFEAIKYCASLAEKGYHIFIQPMVTISYSDEELLELIKLVNEFNPYAFYVADSFGVMKRDDLLRLVYLINHNLNSEIRLGYHAHNNLQLAFSNAKAFLESNVKRDFIIDSSIFGMGRGAGNLNTELFINYLCSTYDANYKIYPLLKVIDECINKIYFKNSWGYSLPHFLSASYNCHPNYASYLSDKNTLTVEQIDCILSKISKTQSYGFNKDYIERLYNKYQENKIDDIQVIETLTGLFKNNNILIIAPGSSLKTMNKEILNYIMEFKPIIISSNFLFEELPFDFIFLSNSKRYEQLMDEKLLDSFDQKLLLTSNIKNSNNYKYVINHHKLLNEISLVEDNSVLMLLKLLINLDVSKVHIAGFDGYTLNNKNNYFNEDISLTMNDELIENLNKGISTVLKDISKKIDIKYITPTKYNLNL